MNTVEEVRKELATLTQLLTARQNSSIETLSRTDRIYWNTYVSALEETIAVLRELIWQLKLPS